MTTPIKLLFGIAMATFIAGALMNAILTWMYWNAYRREKKSKIIMTLTALFFWKMLMFIALLLLSYAQFAGNNLLGLVVRALSIPIFMVIIYELYHFALWSTDPDGISEKKMKNVKGYHPRGW